MSYPLQNGNGTKWYELATESLSPLASEFDWEVSVRVFMRLLNRGGLGKKSFGTAPNYAFLRVSPVITTLLNNSSLGLLLLSGNDMMTLIISPKPGLKFLTSSSFQIISFPEIL